MFKNVPSFVGSAVVLTLGAIAARADIYQWEYNDPNFPDVGKHASSTLAPDGAGVDAVPGADLHSLNLTMAYLNSKQLQGANAQFANLTNASLYQSNLTSANLANANLTDASLNSASSLTNANFTGAIIKGADFANAFGFTATQLCSTASYVNGDLSGIRLQNINLTGVNLTNQNLTGAIIVGPTNLTNADVTGANLTGVILGATLTNANFTNSNLTNASLNGATLTNANFTGAVVKAADFFGTTLTAGQLTSTASYASGDLSGIKLYTTDLTGVNFGNRSFATAQLRNVNLTGTNFTNANLSSASIDGGSNLTNANLTNANLTGTDLSNADVTNANFAGAMIKGANVFAGSFTAAQLYSTASYAAHDLSGIQVIGNLTGWSLANQNLSGASVRGSLTNVNFTNTNLTNANLAESTTTNANFTGAIVKGANFSNTDFTATQLAGTASYANGDLSGVNLSNLDLTGWNFANQNLVGANFDSSLLTNTNFTGSDLRNTFWAADASTVTHNAIQPDGSVQGLSLLAGEKLVVRNNTTPVSVNTSATFDPTSTLHIVFDGSAWGSTLSFAPGIQVTRGGTLDLEFVAGIDLSTQVGRTFDLFDWTGVSPTGAFTVSSPYTWNLGNFYTTGEVTLLGIPGLPGDFNHDGTVNAADYVAWRKTGDSAADYNDWRTHFGQTAFSGSSLPSGESLSAAVPEPAGVALVICGLVISIASYRRATTRPGHLPDKSAIVVLSIAVASTSHLAPAHAATIKSLGFDGVPHGVTNDGSLVVGEYSFTSFYAGFQNNAFAWKAVGGMKTLGSGAAVAVTADGSLAVGQLNGGTTFSGGQSPFSPIRWTKTATVSLGLPAGVSSAGAFGMSADGSIVMIESGSCGGGGCVNGGYSSQFYRWTQASGVVPLGFGGGWGTGVSADGSVIVGYIPGPRAYRWTAATGAADLGTLNGALSSEALAVSADGSVVVGESGGHAFRWTESTGLVDLGIDGAAFAISGDGSTVIGGYDNSGSGPDAFIWNQSSGARWLTDVLHDDYGLDTNGWFLNRALAISPNGRFIVGRGITPSGNGVWMADLEIPEPPSLMLAGFGLVCLFAPARCFQRN